MLFAERDLLRAMRQECVSQIRHLEVKNHLLLVTKHHRRPRHLEFITDKTPCLKNFKLTSDFNTTAGTHVATSGSDRTWQECRSLLEMSEFLILRHPSLQSLIWPCESGVTLNGRIWLSIELTSKDMRSGTSDQVINSKAIHRYSWIELHDTPLEAVFRLNDAETSEGPEPDLFLEVDCRLIEELEYMTPAAQCQLGHKGAACNLPRMIHTAKVNKVQRICEESEEQARKRREQVDLQWMADFTSGSPGNSNNKGRRSPGIGRRIREFHAGAAFHTTQIHPLIFKTQSSSATPDTVVG